MTGPVRARQRAIRSSLVDNSDAGFWEVVVTPFNTPPLNIAMFRNVPVQLGSFSFTDPFGPKSFTLRFPQITVFDRLGEGDLAWLHKFANMDIYWTGDIPSTYPFGRHRGTVWEPEFRWEGYIQSFDWSAGEAESGLEIQCLGALRQLDDYMAKPEFPARPLPYEWAISRQFLQKPALRLQPMRIGWPTWWSKTYTPPPKKTAPYMIPTGVTKGKRWTGLLTRSTGSWEPVLTGYIQTLLQSMYTDRGRFTLDLNYDRVPVLLHRNIITKPQNNIAVLDPTLPGVKLRLSEDWSQSIGAVYAQGTSLAGNAYSGMQVSADGQQTYYEPMAYRRQVHPTEDDNGWLDRYEMRREVLVQVQAGLSADDAAAVARAHLQRFADPGITGQIVLDNVDPKMDGIPLARALVRAGLRIHIPNLFGRPEGVLLHISESTSDFTKGVTTLTVDSKFRDALTVDEVRLRGRDSLSVSRMLVAGGYVPPVSDQLYPWNYAEGSGYIPSNKAFSALRLFKKMPDDERFPWESWTKAHPPKSPRWRSCYVAVGAKSSNANENWAHQPGPAGARYGVPIRMSQAGQVRLLQVAAYDRDGNVMKVPFHISFFSLWSVNYQSMPMIPAAQADALGYPAGQRHPFVVGGFERYKSDGTLQDPKVPQTVESAGLIRAYGTSYERAGFFPGSDAAGDGPTGLLADESIWSYDLTNVGHSSFNPYSPKGNLVNPMAGNVYAMIYCDAQGSDPVYFLGRMYRVEPGTG